MKLKYKTEVMNLDGSPIGVPVDSGDEFRGVLHMNGTAADILELLKTDVTEEELVAAMQRNYDAAEEDIRRNVRKVLNTLREYGLLAE